MRSISNHPLIVLIIVLLVTGTIAFFTIYSPKNNPFSPSKEGPQTENNTPVSTAPTAVAISKNPSYILQLVDMKSLVELYSTLRVWGKTYTGNNTAPLNTLIVYLTSQPGKIEVRDPSGNIAFSYTATFQKDILELSVFLPNETLNSINASGFFGAAVTLAGSKIGGTNMTIPQIPNNQKVSGLFKITPIILPTNKP